MSDVENTQDDPTKAELYEKAQALDIDGRSSMDKDELAAAIAAAEKPTDEPPADERDEENEPPVGYEELNELLRQAFHAGTRATDGPTPNLSSDEVRQAILRATGVDVG